MKKQLHEFHTFLETKSQWIVLTLVVLVVVTGFVYAVYRGDRLPYPDERDYYTLAKNLISKHTYTLNGEQPTAFRPPGYPLFLALFVLLGADVVWLRIINFVVLGFSIYLLFALVRRASSQMAGLLAGLLVIAYPVLFYTAGTLYPQTFGSCLFLLILLLLSNPSSISMCVFLLAGFLLGYLILTIPSFIFVCLVMVVWVLVSKRRELAKMAFALVCATSLVVAIWCVRNYVVFNAFIFVSSNSGLDLLLGNSANTKPDSGVGVDLSEYTAKVADKNEAERDTYYRSAAITFVLENQPQAIKLYFLKVLNYFAFHNSLATQSEESSANDVVMLLTYGPLLLLFLLRVLNAKRWRPSGFELLLILLYVANAFFSAIFFTRIRFRLPFDFLLIAVVAMFLGHVISENTMRPAPL